MEQCLTVLEITFFILGENGQLDSLSEIEWELQLRQKSSLCLFGTLLGICSANLKAVREFIHCLFPFDLLCQERALCACCMQRFQRGRLSEFPGCLRYRDPPPRKRLVHNSRKLWAPFLGTVFDFFVILINTPRWPTPKPWPSCHDSSCRD